MDQSTVQHYIAHCDRAIEGLRLLWLEGDAQRKADVEATALRLHDARMVLLAYEREHRDDDAWDVALTQLVEESSK